MALLSSTKYPGYLIAAFVFSFQSISPSLFPGFRVLKHPRSYSSLIPSPAAPVSDLILQLIQPHCPTRCSNCRANRWHLGPGANISESFFPLYALITKLITLQREAFLPPVALPVGPQSKASWNDVSSFWIDGNRSKSGWLLFSIQRAYQWCFCISLHLFQYVFIFC